MSETKATLLKLFLALIVASALVQMCNSSGDGKDEKPAQIMSNVHFTGTQIEFTNLDSVPYHEIELTLNGKYDYKIESLDPGMKYQVGLLNFSDEEGNRFHLGLKAKKLGVFLKRNGEGLAETYEMKD